MPENSNESENINTSENNKTAGNGDLPEKTRQPAILIVDDIAANRLALRKLLKRFDVEFIEADSGIDALSQAVAHTHIALILMDVQMPLMDGFEAAELLKDEPQTKHVPLIFLTAIHREEAQILKGYRAGAVDYIPKPIVPEVLKSKVSVFLDLWRLKAGLEAEIHRRHEAEERINYIAHHDELTSLPNRRSLINAFEMEISRAQRNNTKFAILVVDLDGFKAVNDTLGHEAGDVALVEVARRLKTLVRKHDTLARVGGDEFVIIMSEILEVSQLNQKIDLVIEEVSKPIAYQDTIAKVGASIGMVMYPDDGTDIDELLRYADSAMYQSKKSGGSQLTYYNQ